MKQFIVLALVVLATVYAQDEDQPQRRRPAVFVKKTHRVNKTEALQFNFALAHVEELNEQNVTLYKIVQGKRKPEVEEAKFNVSLTTLDGEEFKQWWEENKTGKDGEPKPFPNIEFKSAVIGDVNIASVTCEDQAAYLVHYDAGVRAKVPKSRRGMFSIRVRGCGKPKDN